MGHTLSKSHVIWGLLAFGVGMSIASIAQAQGSSGTIYIDSAIPQTTFRSRFDAAHDDNRPDRAEFFYPKYGAFRSLEIDPMTHRIKPGIFFDPRAPGPDEKDARVDFRDVSGYLEWAPSNCLSGFVEVPYRFLLPEPLNPHVSGFTDMNAGFKWALLYEPDQVATFQLRTYIPTGDSFRGLGTHHVSLEPALLVYRRFTDRLTLEGELRDWIPIGGTDFQGNVTRYGIGFSYLAYESCGWRLTPVAEVVGWTVLDGKETVPPIEIENQADLAAHLKSAGGDTIVNVHVGFRLGWGENSDFAVSYGRALTGAVWQKDIVRLEYRLRF
jgi:hypothetical protein